MSQGKWWDDYLTGQDDLSSPPLPAPSFQQPPKQPMAPAPQQPMAPTPKQPMAPAPKQPMAPAPKQQPPKPDTSQAGWGDFWDTVVRAAGDFPGAFMGAQAKLSQGDDPYAVIDEGDVAIEKANQAQQESLKALGDKASRTVLPLPNWLSDEDITLGTIAKIPQNFAFSTAARIPFNAEIQAYGVGGGLVGGLLGGALRGGPAAAKGAQAGYLGTVSGMAAYRMEVDNAMREFRAIEDQRARFEGRPPLTDKEWSEKYAPQYLPVAQSRGKWEAWPEAVVGAIGLPMGIGGVKEMAKGNLVKGAMKIGASTGLDLLGEATTEIGQTQENVDAGVNPNARPSFLKLQDWRQAISNVAPDTLALGGTAAGISTATGLTTKAVKAAVKAVLPTPTVPNIIPLVGQDGTPVEPTAETASSDLIAGTQSPYNSPVSPDLTGIPEFGLPETTPTDPTGMPLPTAPEGAQGALAGTPLPEYGLPGPSAPSAIPTQGVQNEEAIRRNDVGGRQTGQGQIPGGLQSLEAGYGRQGQEEGQVNAQALRENAGQVRPGSQEGFPGLQQGPVQGGSNLRGTGGQPQGTQQAGQGAEVVLRPEVSAKKPVIKRLLDTPQVRRAANNGWLNVAETPDQIPEAIRKQMGDAGNTRGFVVPGQKGKPSQVWLVESNIPDDLDTAVFSHEVGVHLASLEQKGQDFYRGFTKANGVLQAIGLSQAAPSFERTLAKIDNRVRHELGASHISQESFDKAATLLSRDLTENPLTEAERAFVTPIGRKILSNPILTARMSAQTAASQTGQSTALLSEETFGYLAEQNQNHGMVKRVTGEMKGLMHRLGLDVNLDAKDYAMLAMNAAKAVTSQPRVARPAFTGNPAEAALRYSREPEQLLKALDAGELDNISEEDWIAIQEHLVRQKSSAVPKGGVGSASFNTWFGNSKVTDRTGAPAKMYHGTAKPFETSSFDPNRLASNTGHPTAPLGFFFTNDQTHAAWKYGGETMETYLSLQNPYQMTDADLRAIEEPQDARAFRKKLEARGYDGILMPKEAGTHYVVAFHPDQIKLSSNKTFTKGNPDFRYSKQSYFDVGEIKQDKTGRYIGAPDWVGGDPKKLEELRVILRKLAFEGEKSRYWYEKSSKAIMDFVKGDKVAAEKFVGLIALYSPNTPVVTNMMYALKAWTQYHTGQKVNPNENTIKAGTYPNKSKSVAFDWLKHGKPYSGIKVNNFYNDLMEEIDPSKVEHATMDMWMALAFDYGKKTFTDAQFKFAKRETIGIAKELGWKPHQVQAAIWSAIKARTELTEKERFKYEIENGISDKAGRKVKVRKGKEKEHFHASTRIALAAPITKEQIDERDMDFSHIMNDAQVQISWEATPGKSSGVLPGIFNAPVEQKMEYMDAVYQVLNPKGKNAIAEMIGVTIGRNIRGISALKGDIGSGVQTFATIPIIGSKGKKAPVTEGKQALDIYSAALGYVLNQEAVAWYLPVYGGGPTKENGAEIQGIRPPTEAEMQALYNETISEFGTDELAPGYTELGMNVINYDKQLKNKPYQGKMEAVVNRVIEKNPDFLGGGVTVGRFSSSGNIVSNKFEDSPNGESYLSRIIAAGRPDLQAGLEDLRSRVQAVNERFSEKYNWGNPGIRRSVAEGSRGRNLRPVTEHSSRSARVEPDSAANAALKDRDIVKERIQTAQEALSDDLRAMSSLPSGSMMIGAWRPMIEKKAPDLAARINWDQADPKTRYYKEQLGDLATETRFSKKARWADGLPPEVRAMSEKIGAKPMSLMDRITATQGERASRFRQGMIDRFSRLLENDIKRFGEDFLESEQNVEDSGWVGAKMGRTPTAALEAAVKHGPLFWDKGGINVRPGRQGLAKVLEQVAKAGELDRFWQWIIANRSERLAAEGREHLFTKPEIAASKKLDQGTMKDGSLRDGVYQRTFNQYVEINKSILDLAEQAGMVDPALRSKWEHDFYLPYFRQVENDSNQTGVKGTKGFDALVNQKAIRELKGGRDKLGDPLNNIMMNWAHLIDVAGKNRAAQKAIETAVVLGIATKVSSHATDKTSVMVHEGGKKTYYNVSDSLTYDALTMLSSPEVSGRIMSFFNFFKVLKTRGITISPAFKAANLINDSLQSISTSGVSPFIPKNLYEGWKATAKGNPMAASIQAGGGTFRFGTLLEGAGSAEKAIKGFRADTVLDTPGKIKSMFQTLGAGLRAWDNFGDRLENINRAAIYKQYKDQGKSHLQAALAARDMMDFSQSGAWPAVRFLTSTVPFLNARLQGMDVLYRKGFKPIGKTLSGQATATQQQQAGRFAAVTTATSLAGIALYLAYKDDEDFKRREQWDRDTYYWFKIFGKEYRIPRGFEVGAITTLFERMVEQAVDDEATGGLFAERLGHMLTQTFAFNPIPQAFNPPAESIANQNFFTKRTIETIDMERLSPQLRYRPTTSAAAILASQALEKAGIGYSPVKIENMVNGYMGWLGGQALLLGDMMARDAMDLPEKPTSGRELPLLGDLVFGDLKKRFAPDGKASRYLSEFYDQYKKIEQSYNDSKELFKRGDVKGAKEQVLEKLPELEEYKTANAVSKRLRMISRAERAIGNDRTMTGEQKRKALEKAAEMKHQVTKTYAEYRRMQNKK